MMVKNFTVLLMALIFCFSFTAKQIQQTDFGFFDDHTVQDVLPESTNSDNKLVADNELDVIDEIILIPLLKVVSALLLIVSYFFSRLYSQPTFLVPERPPSIK
jgi:hypothetical protein